MANVFKAKKILSSSGIYSSIVTAPNLVYNTGDQSISGIKTFTDNVNYGIPSGNFDFGLRTFVSSESGGKVVFQRGGSIPTVHAYGIVFEGGNIANKKGYLTVGSDATNYNNASLDWTNRILSGQWKTDQRLLINGTGVLLSGEAAQLPDTIVYTTGDQIISGGKNFDERPTVNTTGVLLSGEAYPSNNPSGFVTITEINNLSGNLQSQIDILSVNSIAYAVALG